MVLLEERGAHWPEGAAQQRILNSGVARPGEKAPSSTLGPMGGGHRDARGYWGLEQR